MASVSWDDYISGLPKFEDTLLSQGYTLQDNDGTPTWYYTNEDGDYTRANQGEIDRLREDQYAASLDPSKQGWGQLPYDREYIKETYGKDFGTLDQYADWVYGEGNWDQMYDPNNPLRPYYQALNGGGQVYQNQPLSYDPVTGGFEGFMEQAIPMIAGGLLTFGAAGPLMGALGNVAGGAAAGGLGGVLASGSVDNPLGTPEGVATGAFLGGVGGYTGSLQAGSDRLMSGDPFGWGSSIGGDYDFSGIGDEWTNVDATSGLGTGSSFENALNQVSSVGSVGGDYDLTDLGNEWTNTDATSGLGTGQQFEDALKGTTQFFDNTTDITDGYDLEDIGSEHTNVDDTSGLGTGQQFENAINQVSGVSGVDESTITQGDEYTWEDLGSEHTNTDPTSGLGTGEQFETAINSVSGSVDTGGDEYDWEDFGNEHTNTDSTSGLGTGEQFEDAFNYVDDAANAGRGAEDSKLRDKLIKAVTGGNMPIDPKILGAVLSGGAAILGQNEVSGAYDDVRDLGETFNVGNTRFNETFDPNYSLKDDPALKAALEAQRDQMYRRLSTKRGNVMWDPYAMMETENYLLGNVALPYLQDTRGLNLKQAEIGADLVGNAIIGKGLSEAGKWGAGASTIDDIFNPADSLQDILEIISGGASTPKTGGAVDPFVMNQYLNNQFGDDWAFTDPGDWIGFGEELVDDDFGWW